MIRFDERLRIPAWIAAIVLAGVLASCNMGNTPDTTAPTVLETTPSGLVVAPTNEPVTATFSEEIDVSTLTTSTFTLAGPGPVLIEGSVSYDAATDTATYTPDVALDVATAYTATLSTDVTDVAGNPLEADVTWTFTTDVVAAATDRVPLSGASEFVLLSKTGISATAGTSITGDIGVSPAALSYITGFDIMGTVGDPFVTSALVDGNIYAANLADPTPALMTAAISAMETAYTNAAGRTMPDTTEFAAGSIGSETIEPGLHTWSSAVDINTNLTLTGSATDVWVFQIAQDLTVASNVIVGLAGEALPENVFWQVAGQVTLGTGSTMHGILLSKTAVVMATNANLTGRAYAQAEITLDANSITQPLN